MQGEHPCNAPLAELGGLAAASAVQDARTLAGSYDRIRDWIPSRAAPGVWLGPPCSTWTRARRPPLSAGGPACAGSESVDAHLFSGSEFTQGGGCWRPLLQEWTGVQPAEQQALLKGRHEAREERELAKKGDDKKGKKEEEG